MIWELVVDNVLVISNPMNSFPYLNYIQKQSYMNYKNCLVIKYFLVFDFAHIYFKLTRKLLGGNDLITSNPMDSFPSLNSIQKQSYVHYKIPSILPL